VDVSGHAQLRRQAGGVEIRDLLGNVATFAPRWERYDVRRFMSDELPTSAGHDLLGDLDRVGQDDLAAHQAHHDLGDARLAGLPGVVEVFHE